MSDQHEQPTPAGDSAMEPLTEGVPAPPPPAAAAAFLGAHAETMTRFAAVLADTGVTHGLIGPREVPRLWDRHLLNCAVVEDAFPPGATVLDIGSGAGLPGLALAIVRPDLQLVLVEPMLRRTTWLQSAVVELGLDNVTVLRGRAEDVHGQVSAPFATARAVARLEKLARWTLPLLDPGGTLVAMKGTSAARELAEDRKVLARLGVVAASVTAHGSEVLEQATMTIDLVVGDKPRPRRRTR